MKIGGKLGTPALNFEPEATGKKRENKLLHNNNSSISSVMSLTVR